MTGDPERLAMFPLSTVLFPGAMLPLHVFEPRYRTMMADCLAAEPAEFGVVLIERGSEMGGGDVRTDVGTVARVERMQRAEDGRYAVLARGTTRLRVMQWLPDDPYPQALVVRLDGPVPEQGADSPQPGGEGAAAHALAAVRRVEALLGEMGSPLPGPPLWSHAPLWELCARLPVNALDRQRLLAVDDADARATLLAELADAVGDDLARILAGG